MNQKILISISVGLVFLGVTAFCTQKSFAASKTLDYFLIGVWAQPPKNDEHTDNFGFWKSIGVNTLVGHDTGPQKNVTEKQWDTAAKAAGLKFIRLPSPDIAYDVSQYNSGHLVAWMIRDEQDKIAANKGVWNDATVKEAVLDPVAATRAKAPQIPVTANFMGTQFGYGRNNWYKKAVDVLDFYSYDWYPFNTGYEIEIAFIERTETISNWTGKRPMIYIETSDQRLYKDPSNQNPAYSYRVSRMRGPTPEEIRMEIVLAVSLGAPGILFFADSFYPFEYDGTTPAGVEMIRRETAVWKNLTPDPGTDIAGLPQGLKGRRRIYNGSYAKIITNHTPQAVSLNLTSGQISVPANNYIILNDSDVVVVAPSQNSNQQETPQALNATCSVSATQAKVLDNVRWTASPTGGNGSYSYIWNGTDNASSTASQFDFVYTRSGTKNMSLVVRSGTETKNISCPTIQITEIPLLVSCSVQALRQSPTETRVQWSVQARGGINTYATTMTGTDGLFATTTFAEKIYTNAGTKEASISVVSGDQTKNVQCRVTLPQPPVQENQVYGSCGSTHNGLAVEWRAVGQSRDGTPLSYTWTGSEGVFATSSVFSHAYTSPGLKTGTVTITSPTSSMSFMCSTIISDAPVTTSNCFIATAAFGTPMEKEVQILRDFRDEKLLTNTAGRLFVDAYYAVSPVIADTIRKDETLKGMTRGLLRPVIDALQ